jgi:hypothetical protein
MGSREQLTNTIAKLFSRDCKTGRLLRAQAFEMMVSSPRFERGTCSLGGCRSILLSYEDAMRDLWVFQAGGQARSRGGGERWFWAARGGPVLK